ncbi:RES domain-containing protein [Lactiplantibacillus nangangensis]|uniref:RES domain-containing protein n=1 Tax=Lactiplantibacillus nangangensis TaxID=2559917 RepID=A0ABW1SFV0_9LACO|nr:RES domain-containing protein [Lactiplantibacillus nangangensis]
MGEKDSLKSSSKNRKDNQSSDSASLKNKDALSSLSVSTKRNAGLVPSLNEEVELSADTVQVPSLAKPIISTGIISNLSERVKLSADTVQVPSLAKPIISTGIISNLSERVKLSTDIVQTSDLAKPVINAETMSSLNEGVKLNTDTVQIPGLAKSTVNIGTISNLSEGVKLGTDIAQIPSLAAPIINTSAGLVASLSGMATRIDSAQIMGLSGSENSIVKKWSKNNTVYTGGLEDIAVLNGGNYSLSTDSTLEKLNDSLIEYSFRKNFDSNFLRSGVPRENADTITPAWIEVLGSQNLGYSHAYTRAQNAIVKHRNDDDQDSVSTVKRTVGLDVATDFISTSNNLKLSKDELEDFQSFLSETSMLGATHPVGKKIFEHFSKVEGVYTNIDFALYHGRKQKGRNLRKSELGPATFGIPGAGRFNSANQGYYYTSNDIRSIPNELKLDTGDVCNVLEFYLNHDIRVFDLTKEDDILIDLCLQSVSSPEYSVPLEYQLPAYIAECLYLNSNVQAIKVGSALFDDVTNYILFSFSTQDYEKSVEHTISQVKTK